jgi:ElaA protein
MRWELKTFRSLTAAELYEALRLRAEVFVVEQNCVYQDCDGHDPHCRHLFGWKEGKLAAYLRIVPPGRKYEETSLGRVVTGLGFRGQRLGHGLVEEALRLLDAEGAGAVRISAQAYLEKFYAGFGFVAQGEGYLEDGIPHIEMLRAAPRT